MNELSSVCYIPQTWTATLSGIAAYSIKLVPSGAIVRSSTTCFRLCPSASAGEAPPTGGADLDNEID